MLVFAAITPHTPLLIPSIGRDNLQTMKASVSAMKRLGDELYAAQPDTVIILSSHAGEHPEAFSANLHDEYVIDFKEFGDLSVDREYRPDLDLIARIVRHMRGAGIPFTLNSNASLGYGDGVPLYSLLGQAQARVVPIAHSSLDAREHLRFGAALKEVIDTSSGREAVVAAGDLSHALSAQSPLGLRREGEAYDRAVVEAVKNFSASTLLNLDAHVIEASGQCLFEQLLILFGILEKKLVRPEILSYEAPFGVGYLTAQFHLTDV